MTLRDKVYAKYNGLCAYTGKPLGDVNCKEWQIDHVIPKSFSDYDIFKEYILKTGYKTEMGIYNAFRALDKLLPDEKKEWEDFKKIKGNCIANLLPCLKIINHYKRALGLEGFRKYIATLQDRINKLPKYLETAIIRDLLEKNTAYYSWQIKKAKYIKQVAELFGITPETPFSGRFWFEAQNG